MSGGYTDEVINILNQEFRRTDFTGEILLPIIREVVSINNWKDQDLLCRKLLIEAEIFNKK